MTKGDTDKNNVVGNVHAALSQSYGSFHGRIGRDFTVATDPPPVVEAPQSDQSLTMQSLFTGVKVKSGKISVATTLDRKVVWYAADTSGSEKGGVA